MKFIINLWLTKICQILLKVKIKYIVICCIKKIVFWKIDINNRKFMIKLLILLNNLNKNPNKNKDKNIFQKLAKKSWI